MPKARGPIGFSLRPPGGNRNIPWLLRETGLFNGFCEMNFWVRDGPKQCNVIHQSPHLRKCGQRAQVLKVMMLDTINDNITTNSCCIFVAWLHFIGFRAGIYGIKSLTIY